MKGIYSSVEPAKANKKTKGRSLLKQIFGEGKKNETLKVVSPTTESATDAPSDVPQTNWSSQPSYPLFVGKHTYLSQRDSDLGFKEGDLLYILIKGDTRTGGLLKLNILAKRDTFPAIMSQSISLLLTKEKMLALVQMQ